MRLQLNLIARRNIRLPFHYRDKLQSFVYDNLPETGDKLHNKGYGARNYKMFTYSNVFSRYFTVSKKNKCFDFGKQIRFQLSFYEEDRGKELLMAILDKKEFDISGNILYPKEIEVLSRSTHKGKFKTISPITIYTGNGKRTFLNPKRL